MSNFLSLLGGGLKRSSFISGGAAIAFGSKTAALAEQPATGNAQTGTADDKLLDTWRLVSYDVEVQTTGEKLPVMGQNPTGYVAFLPEGRIFFVLTGEGRKPAKTDQERAGLLNSLVAYTGNYRIDADRFITKVDVAWNPEWVGTEQVRNFKVDGDLLNVSSPWRMMSNWADKGMTRSIVTFRRAK